MQSLAHYMSLYQRHHTKMATKITHFVGVPMVVFAMMMFFTWFHIRFGYYAQISVAWVIVLATLVYYFLLEIPMATITAAIMIPMMFIAQALAHYSPRTKTFGIFILVFVVGWIIQFIGHAIEKKHPAFFDNVFHGVIAPIYLVAEVCFLLGYRKDLQREVNELAKQPRD